MKEDPDSFGSYIACIKMTLLSCHIIEMALPKRLMSQLVSVTYNRGSFCVIKLESK